jgi:hypothetical protein
MLRLSKLFSKTSTESRVGNLTVAFYCASADRHKKIEWMFRKRERHFIFVHARLRLNHVTSKKSQTFIRHVHSRVYRHISHVGFVVITAVAMSSTSSILKQESYGGE